MAATPPRSYLHGMKFSERPLRDQPGWWALNGSLFVPLAIGGVLSHDWFFGIGGGIAATFLFARAYLTMKANSAKGS